MFYLIFEFNQFSNNEQYFAYEALTDINDLRKRLEKYETNDAEQLNRMMIAIKSSSQQKKYEKDFKLLNKEYVLSDKNKNKNELEKLIEDKKSILSNAQRMVNLILNKQFKDELGYTDLLSNWFSQFCMYVNKLLIYNKQNDNLNLKFKELFKKSENSENIELLKSEFDELESEYECMFRMCLDDIIDVTLQQYSYLKGELYTSRLYVYKNTNRDQQPLKPYYYKNIYKESLNRKHIILRNLVAYILPKFNDLPGDKEYFAYDLLQYIKFIQQKLNKYTLNSDPMRMSVELEPLR